MSLYLHTNLLQLNYFLILQSCRWTTPEFRFSHMSSVPTFSSKSSLTCYYFCLCSPSLSYPILSYPILSYPILSYPILSYPIFSYTVLHCPLAFYRVTRRLFLQGLAYHWSVLLRHQNRSSSRLMYKTESCYEISTWLLFQFSCEKNGKW